MLKLHALENDGERNLPLLGILRNLDEKKSATFKLSKKICIAGVGDYTKTATASLYSKKSMEKRGALNIMGALGNCQGAAVLGYVVQHCGMHDLCLPVYTLEQCIALGNRICGYVATENGIFAVTKRGLLGFKG